MAVRNPIRPATGAEVLDLRHFASADLRPLLEEEVEQWGEALAWDYRSSSEMILRYVDAKILPGYAAVEIRLMESVLETLQNSPGVHRVEAQLLAHNTGEVAEPFVTHGFHRHRRLFLCLDLAAHAQSARKSARRRETKRSPITPLLPS